MVVTCAREAPSGTVVAPVGGKLLAHGAGVGGLHWWETRTALPLPLCCCLVLSCPLRPAQQLSTAFAVKSGARLAVNCDTRASIRLFGRWSNSAALPGVGDRSGPHTSAPAAVPSSSSRPVSPGPQSSWLHCSSCPAFPKKHGCSRRCSSP